MGPEVVVGVDGVVYSMRKLGFGAKGLGELELVFEGADDAFGECVFVGVGSLSHGAQEPVVVKQLRKSAAVVLCAAVGVVDDGQLGLSGA